MSDLAGGERKTISCSGMSVPSMRRRREFGQYPVHQRQVSLMVLNADPLVHGLQLAQQIVLHLPLVIHQLLQPGILLRLHGGVHLPQLIDRLLHQQGHLIDHRPLPLLGQRAVVLCGGRGAG